MSSVEGLGVMLLRELTWINKVKLRFISVFKTSNETIFICPPQLTSGYLSSNSSSGLGVSVKSIPDYVYSQLSSPQVTSPEAKKLLQEIYSTSQRGNALLIKRGEARLGLLLRTFLSSLIWNDSIESQTFANNTIFNVFIEAEQGWT